jgi:hypothetical protein
LIESSRLNSLEKSFKIIDKLHCSLECSKNDHCSIAIIDSWICNIYIKVELQDSITIYSPTATIYVKNSEGYEDFSDYLIHYWPFNGNYFDVTSNANLFNPIHASFVPNRFGRAFSSVYLKYGSLQAPNGTYIYGDFTLTAWVKMHSLEVMRRLIFLISPSHVAFSLTFNQNTGPYYYSKICDQNQISNTSLTIGKWQHLAFTIKASTLSIYIDGVVVYNGNTTALSVENRTDIRIGSEGYNHANAEFDDIKIFNRSLSQAEIIKSSLNNL